jgi:hypothetical protein
VADLPGLTLRDGKRHDRFGRAVTSARRRTHRREQRRSGPRVIEGGFENVVFHQSEWMR